VGEVSVPEARRDAALRRFELRRLRVPIGGQMVSMVVPDAASYLREGGWVEDAALVREPPYWVELWPASIAIARLLNSRSDLTKQRVLDLGCGLGLPVACAARLGAKVTLVDRNPDALAFAHWNVSRHASMGGTVVARQLDWSSELLDEAYDVVVLADVTYRQVHHAGVFRQLGACLADEGVILHAEPCRAESNDFVRRLERQFETVQARWRVHTEKGPVTVRMVAAARKADLLNSWREELVRKAIDGEGSVAAEAES